MRYQYKYLPLFLIVFLLCFQRIAAQTNIPTTATAPAVASALRLPSDYSQIPSNYLREFAPQIPVTDSAQVNMSALPENILIRTDYIDLFGRKIQSVAKQASPLKNDVVAPYLFDELGRNPLNYLPFISQSDNYNDGTFKKNAFYQDSVFYKGLFPNEQINYGITQFDNSPFNIAIKTTAPGNSWTGAGVGISYTHRSNTASDSVRLWTIAISTEDDVPTTSAVYSAGTLTVQQATDERGNKSVVYTDELGREILTKTQLSASPSTGHAGWLCTYYVYDEMNHLRMVIPPKAVEALNTSSINWNSNGYATPYIGVMCYFYWYNSLGQLLMKNVPGKGKMYLAYDLQSRLVMTQDANLRSSSQWTFLKYDGENRIAQSGIITMGGMTAAQVQTAAAAITNYPTLTGTYTITGETYYDDYSWTNAGTPNGNLISTNINSTNFFTTYNTSPEYAQPVTQSYRVRGAATGTKKLVLGTSTYLYTAILYDDNGRTIQIKQTNYTSGTDVATLQYSFSGRVLRSHLQHQKAGNTMQNHTLLTKYTYDHTGRLKTITKNIDGTGDKTIAQTAYNELGQASSKTLGSSVETQAFSYNIRGWLTGINKGYVETVNSTNYWGEELFYNYGFTTAQLNGNIAGAKWRSKGDGIQRAYGYGYDNTNRLLTADFTQQNSGSTLWTQDKMDFSVSGVGYDGNGNITAMKQRGVAINKPVTIDSLAYTYLPNSNQLQKVSDGIADASPWGDFKDTSSAADDYAYDVNGNIAKDYNKHIHTGTGANGTTYNILDKPDNITVNGKGTIAYVYDAGGALLQKTVTDTRTGIKKVITYVAGFVYQKTLPQTGNASTTPDTLQYLLHEEGRIRWSVTQATPSGAFVYDYFLKDHQGNVRSIVTEETRTDTYPTASLETATLATEKNYYTNLDAGRTDRTNVAGYPTNDTYTSPNTFVQKLNGSGTKVGAGILLKVMAGDRINVHTSSWYASGSPAPGAPVSPLTDLITMLTNSLPFASGSKMTTAQLTTSTLSPSVSGFLFNRDASNIGTQPKAYLNVVLLDEQLNPVITSDGNNSYFEQAGAAGGTSVKQYNISSRLMTKSGYLYVYVSNETPNIDVYWDNLQVTQVRGKLLSEEGYYPFGLAMNALSSHAGTVTSNAYKYNGGTELTEDLDVDYYETFMRQYDAQTGRFTGVDALSEKTINLSPYHYSGNNPVLFNDPSGMLLTVAQMNYARHAALDPYGQLMNGYNPAMEDYAYSDFLNESSGTGGGGSFGGVSSGDWGMSFSGSYASQAFRAIQGVYNNGGDNITLGIDGGRVGYWQGYFRGTGDFSNGLERVELGQTFMAFDNGGDGGGNGNSSTGLVYKVLCGAYNWKTTGAAYTAQIYGLNVFYDNQRTSQKITFSLSPACVTIPKRYSKDSKSTYEVDNAFNDAFNYAIRSVLDELNSLPPGYTLSDWQARTMFLPELRSYLNQHYPGSVFAADDGCSGSGIPASYAKFCFP